MTFPQEREKIGRRRKITADDIRRQGKRRPGYPAHTRQRQRPNDLTSPLRREIQPENISVRFGTQAMLDTQPSPAAQRVKRYSLRPQQDAVSSSERGWSSKMLFSTSEASQHDEKRDAEVLESDGVRHEGPTLPRLPDRYHENSDPSRRSQGPSPTAVKSAGTPSHCMCSGDMLFSSTSTARVGPLAARRSSNISPSDVQLLAPGHRGTKGESARSLFHASSSFHIEMAGTRSADEEIARQRRDLTKELRAAVEKYAQGSTMSQSAVEADTVQVLSDPNFSKREVPARLVSSPAARVETSERRHSSVPQSLVAAHTGDEDSGLHHIQRLADTEYAHTLSSVQEADSEDQSRSVETSNGGMEQNLDTSEQGLEINSEDSMTQSDANATYGEMLETEYSSGFGVSQTPAEVDSFEGCSLLGSLGDEPNGSKDGDRLNVQEAKSSPDDKLLQQQMRQESSPVRSDHAMIATSQGARQRYTFRRPPRFSRGHEVTERVLRIGNGNLRKLQYTSQRGYKHWNIHGGAREVWELRSSGDEDENESTSCQEDDIED